MNSKTQKMNVSRRNLLKFGAGAIGTGVLTAGVGSQLLDSQPAAAKNDVTPDEALKMLMDGNRRFVSRKRKNPNQDFARLTEVAKGQNPFAAILGCADSRVPSEIIFDQGLGDLFVCRVAGNIAPAEEIGSLEFGTFKANVLLQVEKLKSSTVMSKLIEEGKLKIVGGYYDLDTGRVSMVS
jgi:carbonic anhydrase